MSLENSLGFLVRETECARKYIIFLPIDALKYLFVERKEWEDRPDI